MYNGVLSQFELRVREASSAVVVWAGGVYGLRIIARYGFGRTLRIVGLFFWVYALVAVPVAVRSDLLYPGDIGTDSSNYLAASERLLDGHPLYSLEAGDRPVPQDNPPEWSVPILSPPPVALAYLPAALVPDPIGFYAGWAIGLSVIAGLGVFIATSGPLIAVLVLVYISENLATTAWSGNANAWIGLVAVLAWSTSRRPANRWPTAIGSLIGLATAVKIGPGMLGLWLIAERRWRSLATAIAVGASVSIATLIAAGPQVFAEYLTVARDSATTPTSLSIPGIALSYGLDPSFQAMSLLVAILGAATLVLATRRSRPSFAIALVAGVYATTVVRAEAVAVALAVAAAAWVPSTTDSNDGDQMRRAIPRLGISKSAAFAVGFGVIFAAAAITASVATGGLTRSSLSVTNRTPAPVVVRVSLYGQSANFGYRIEPGQAAYGWANRIGTSPPVVTVWTPECHLVGLLWLPGSGSHVSVGAAGTVLDTGIVDPIEYAPYTPDCATELIDFMDNSDFSHQGGVGRRSMDHRVANQIPPGPAADRLGGNGI